jgi:hypothetical protein
LRQGLLIGVALIGLGLTLLMLSRWVQTPRERVMQATRGLVRAVADADRPTLVASLDDSCMLYYFESPTGLGRDAIINAATSRFGAGAPYEIKGGAGGVRIEALQASVRENDAQAQVKVSVTSAQWNMPHRSWWRLDLRMDESGAWRVTGIMPTSIQGIRNASGR